METDPKYRDPVVEAIAAEAIAREERAEQDRIAAAEQAELARVYQLSFWPDERRAMPEAFVFSAVFAAVKTDKQITRQSLASINGLTAIYTGPRLNQVHADVWQGIMHLARQQPEGTLIRFTAHQLLRLIGRHTGKRQREQLKKWIAQLCASDLLVRDDSRNVAFGGHLLTRVTEGDRLDESVFDVIVTRPIARVLESGFGTINWSQRQALHQKPLALWLQLFFSVFGKPVAVAQLHKLSGSTCQLKEFRRMLADALTALHRAGGHAAAIDRERDVVVPCPEARPPRAPRPRRGQQRVLPFERPSK